MGDRRSTFQSRKRIAKALQDEMWDCSVCTYTNSPEAFKCSICDVRKGTSTRKPRLSQHIVAQQEATRLVAQMPQYPPHQVKDSDSDKEEDEPTSNSKTESPQKISKSHKPKLKGIDRSAPITMAVTVNNVTVMFTEYSRKQLQPDCDEKTKR